MTSKQIAKLEKQIAELTTINDSICKDLRSGKYNNHLSCVTTATNDLFRGIGTLQMILMIEKTFNETKK